MTEEQARENAKMVLTIREVCEHAWNAESRCRLDCQKGECWAKGADEQIDCMCKYFLRKNFGNETTR